jgi:hypothetical protein
MANVIILMSRKELAQNIITKMLIIWGLAKFQQFGILIESLTV